MNETLEIGTVYQLLEHPECILMYTGKGFGKGTAIGGIESDEIPMSTPNLWRVYKHIPNSPASYNSKRFTTVVEEVDEAGQASRVFGTGASRNSDEGKLDFEGFLSPTVIKAYAEYMHSMRKLESGELRDSDNWQKGIPTEAYMKSMYRHFFDTWSNYRGLETPEPQKQNLCGLLFNVMGMLHELLKEESNNTETE
mgnify:CR=1 FL=1|tara:strand:+ start:879 stop:1466 length:588 start_codon:yes stop_codon:yes gene_type:complete